MHLIKTIAALSVVAVTLPAIASANDADVIDGFRTNDFNRFWPKDDQAPDGYRQKASNTNPAKHIAIADYEAEDGKSFANARIFGWPMDAPTPVAADDTDIVAKSLDGIRAMMKDEGFPDPTAHDISTPGGVTLSCLTTEQNPVVAEFVYCVTPMKGRVMEVQHFASIEARDKAQRDAVAEGFIGSLVDHVAAAE